MPTSVEFLHTQYIASLSLVCELLFELDNNLSVTRIIMADPSPSVESQDSASGQVQSKSSENTPLEPEQCPRGAYPDASDLDALAAEFSEAEKAVTDGEPAGTLEDDEKLAPMGSICEVKQIFNIGRTEDGEIEWVDKKPERDRTEENEAAENRRMQFSVIRRMTPHGAGGWKTHSILVNSRSIQNSLAKVFDGYPVTYADDHKLVLYPKFIPFCHRWEKLLQVEQDEPDPEIKSHLALLRSTLKINLADSLKQSDLVARTGLASFLDLELLFQPNQIVIHRHSDGVLSAGRVREVSLVEGYGVRYYTVKVYTTAWNGERFGMEKDTWKLDDFSGTRKVHTLDIFPLYMHPDRVKISEKLVQRGKKYEKLRGQHFLAYAGNVKSGYVST